MDEDISIINRNTRNEKIRNFFIKNKKILIISLSTIILIIFGFFGYEEIQKNKKNKIAEKYNSTIIDFISADKTNVKNKLIQIINEKDSTYSPLALYFIIDNEIDASKEEINKYFDVMIEETNLEKEIKNLIIYKKGLFNADHVSENSLIQILNPLINSDSVWKSHALYLMAEYFLYKNQNQKAKEFYNKILEYEKSNENIIIETKKRLSRDFSG
mgnify:FL=1